MTGDCHVRFCESPRFTRATRRQHRAVVNTSRLNGVPLDHCVGEIITIQQVYFKPKVIIAVLCVSFVNSLTSNEGVHLDKINPFGQLLPSSQKQLVWAVVIYFPHLFLPTTVKGVTL